MAELAAVHWVRASRRWLGYLPVLLAPFVMLSPLLLTGKALFWGTPVLQFVPWWDWAYRTLQAGHLPLWNPELGMGAPLLANYQSGLFYPPNWVYFGLRALGGLRALALGQAWMLALHLAWAGLGMMRLVRRLGVNELGQAVSGLAFGLCGYLVARGSFLPVISAAAWLPWILQHSVAPLAVEGPRRGRSFLWLALFLALQLLAGHAQTAWYTWLLAGMWSGFWAWQGSRSRSQPHPLGWTRALGAAWLRLGLAVAIAAALAAVQLLPTAEYLLQSQRSQAVDYERGMTYSFWPWRALSLLAPDLFGNPAHGDYWGYANYWEDALYVGLLPLLLALSALASGLRRPKRAARAGPFPGGRGALAGFLAALLGLSFLFALGKNTPVFPWLYRHVPTFDMFQSPSRYLIWAEFALALLAGFGADAWRRPRGAALYWTRLAIAGAFSISLGAGLALLALGEAVNLTFIRATAIAGVWALGAGALSLLAPHSSEPDEAEGEEAGWRKALTRRYPRLFPPRLPKARPAGGAQAVSARAARLWAWAVVGWVALDLVVTGAPLNPGVDPGLFTNPASTREQLVTRLDGRRLYLPERDEYYLKFTRLLSFESFTPQAGWDELRAVMLPNANLFDGVRMANNFDPLVPGRYNRWMEALEGADLLTKRKLLNLMDVSVVERVDFFAPNRARYDVGGLAPRRVRWVGTAFPADDDEQALQLILSGTVDPNEAVVVEGLPPGQDGSQLVAGGGAGAGRLDLAEDGPNRVTVRYAAKQPGWVVLSDVWYPGWQATIDGEPAQIYRGDYLFRAVAAPAGEHVVEFVYRPVFFYAGLAASLVGLAVFGAAWVALSQGRILFSRVNEM